MYPNAAYPELDRRLTALEYGKAAGRAAELGLVGYVQRRESADPSQTPPFDLTGVEENDW
jgi:hypothetical protein